MELIPYHSLKHVRTHQTTESPVSNSSGLLGTALHTAEKAAPTHHAISHMCVGGAECTPMSPETAPPICHKKLNWSNSTTAKGTTAATTVSECLHLRSKYLQPQYKVEYVLLGLSRGFSLEYEGEGKF